MVAIVLKFKPKPAGQGKNDFDSVDLQLPTGNVDWRTQQKASEELLRKLAGGEGDILTRFSLTPNDEAVVSSYPIEDRNPNLLRALAYGKGSRSLTETRELEPQTAPSRLSRQDSSNLELRKLRFFPKLPPLD